MKHVGHFGIRFSLEDHQRQRDQMAIKCDSQRSNILGHQLIVPEVWRLEHSRVLTHGHGSAILREFTRRNSILYSLKIA